jgi:hypothetical protein
MAAPLQTGTSRMKRATYRSLLDQTRFQLDDQWWVKIDRVTAKHASYDLTIDMRPSSTVLISGTEEAPVSTYHDDERKRMQKREGFFLVLGTIIESFSW